MAKSISMTRAVQKCNKKEKMTLSCSVVILRAMTTYKARKTVHVAFCTMTTHSPL